MRIRVSVILASLALAAAVPAVHAATPTWRTFAECAVSYHIDALDKQLNSQRGPGMQRMIQGQSRDYESAAIRLYIQAHGASHAGAQRTVQSYMRTSRRRFMAMSKAGKLEGFIDACPQIPAH